MKIHIPAEALPWSRPVPVKKSTFVSLQAKGQKFKLGERDKILLRNQVERKYCLTHEIRHRKMPFARLHHVDVLLSKPEAQFVNSLFLKLEKIRDPHQLLDGVTVAEKQIKKYCKPR